MRELLEVDKLWRLLALVGAIVACRSAGQSPDFPGAYALVAYAAPGKHVPSRTVPREFRDMRLVLREDGSATMHIAGSADSEGEYSVNPSDRTSATITSGGAEGFLARFSHDTLVTRVPGGGPSFYWRRTTGSSRK